MPAPPWSLEFGIWVLDLQSWYLGFGIWNLDLKLNIIHKSKIKIS